MQERATEIETLLLFFDLEWAGLDDSHADELLASADLDPADRPAAARLEKALDEQLERAATHAFRNSFLLGAGLAVLALLTVVTPRRRVVAP